MLAFKSLASSSSGNASLLTDDKTMIMLDCGLPWKKIKQSTRFKTSSLLGICATHFHKDHCAGIKDASKSGIDIFMLPETKEALGLNGHRIHEIELLKKFNIGTFSIKAFPLKHDVPTCGFLIMNKLGEKMVYIADTAYCEFKFPALQIIAIECNYQNEILNENIDKGSVPAFMKDRLIHSHLSLKNVIEFLKVNDLNKLKAIYLMHLSNNNCNEQEIKTEVQKITGKPTYICKA